MVSLYAAPKNVKRTCPRRNYGTRNAGTREPEGEHESAKLRDSVSQNRVNSNNRTSKRGDK